MDKGETVEEEKGRESSARDRGGVADKGNGGQPACLEEWKKCTEEHE